MHVLVDSSIWIDYFRAGKNSELLDDLIDINQVAINDVILAELVPFLVLKKEKKLIQQLQQVYRLAMQIDWEGIINDQTKCLKAGINAVGIPDLIIAQNARQHGSPIYTLDKHFGLMKKSLKIELVG